jgi:hypothetical protein
MTSTFQPRSDAAGLDAPAAKDVRRDGSDTFRPERLPSWPRPGTPTARQSDPVSITALDDL